MLYPAYKIFILCALTSDLEEQYVLTMLIHCIKLYNPGAYGSCCITPTTFSFLVTIRPLSSSDLEEQ